ncbi:MAG: EAL domain-containing protein [Ruminococcus sp.]|nr:EAL domain-containing protein [Ruminococcus sp.]
MIGNKKVIGVCLAKIQSIAATEYLSRLSIFAKNKGYKIIVFNSIFDFYNNDSNDIGAKSVYKLINYDTVDAIVIHTDDFRNDHVLDELISDADSHDTPVILLKKYDARCTCIINDYNESYKQLIEHVIRDHNVTDTFFIAGRNDPGDQDSIERIGCYRKALEACGLEYSDELVDYGEYWDIPTINLIERLLEKRGRPPRAIFCANDFMAIAACAELQKRGYRIPEDVIVTGFDGVPESEFTIPQLTTCKEDIQSLAEKTVELLERYFDSKELPKISKNKFTNRLSESCGCKYNIADPREQVRKLYSTVHDCHAHDDFILGWLNSALEKTELTSMMTHIPTLIIAEGYICLNSDFVSQVTETQAENNRQPFTETLDIVQSVYSQEDIGKKNFKSKDMIAQPNKWTDEDVVYVISTINCGENVYGSYVVKAYDIEMDAQRINRSLNALNIAINSMLGYYKQRSMLLGLKNAALTDHITRLPNLKGTTEWFDGFASVPENHKRCLTISVYGMPKYKYIYENYGIREIEESVCIVADTLKASNLPDTFIGHVTDDEFLVINVFDSPEQISGVINEARSKFCNAMQKINAEKDKPYYLEVNSGYAELYPGWEGTLASFSKLAGNAMYLNRLNRNRDTSVSKSKLPADIYKSFEVLIEKNLFDYHFQPIIDAKTGDIFAYEALMRPDKSLDMAPSDVIRTAVEYDRLYDIEQATIFNVLNIFSEKQQSFKKRKVFINSIPGHFLHGEDYDKLLDRYGSYLENIVIEITEGSTVSDAELKLIKGINNGEIPIAIDDYGTGHSNIVNLLRYSPQIIKIDRFLISHIQDDLNKQLFFRSTVEFAGMNNIKILAEGVETAEELKCVTELGADYIQGYFTGRPAPEPLGEIGPEIRAMILDTTK